MTSDASTGVPTCDTTGSPAAEAATYRVPLRWRDLDSQGHVYHAEYLSLADEGRTRWLGETLGLRNPQSYVIAHLSIDYVAELNHAAEHVEFSAIVERVGTKSVRTQETLSIRSGSNSTIVVARITCVLLLWSPETRETRPLTDAERTALELPLATSPRAPGSIDTSGFDRIGQ
ncbi:MULTISPECIES: acyl-CoA thioesterase [Prauserella salsuginis group]|uniref:Acyl-CoA thioesterase n=1 Tax=Prauserella salsuginis TaxID=387889 RepID=A0ABW6G0Q3_9PSEU|nr:MULTISPECIES: hotdog domain-containing protein [Prauserella salsuginis group]MCR3721939.1 acyl-CoA thioester hydrolase [Prauserella flava]MCR3735945.1 acyl-CoA thioester hydrolase [Prauserella salsuginis]